MTSLPTRLNQGMPAARVKTSRTRTPWWTLVMLGLVCPWLGVMPSVGHAAGYSVEAGDILAANYGGNSVLKINPQTGAQENLGAFATPTDLVLSPDGELYVSELGGTIKRLTLTNGAITVINPATTLTAARGLALGSSGELFVTGSGDRVLKVNPLTGAESLVTQADSLTTPVGIDFLDPTHLVVASLLNSPLVVVDLANGRQSVVPGAEGIDYPWGVAVQGDDIYFTRYDQKLVQRSSGGSLYPVRVTQGFPYGIGIETNGNLIVACAGPDVIERISPQGVLLRTFSGGAIRRITGIEISRLRIDIPSNNTAPVLDPIGNKTIAAGATLAFTVTASDPNQPQQLLTFSLEPGAPDGAQISPEGYFRWTPTEAQAPSTNNVTVRVTDDGTPAQNATNTFQIIVLAPVARPRISAITLSPAGWVTISWPAEIGTTYQVQSALSVTNHDWANVEASIVAQHSNISVVTRQPDAPACYYRLLQTRTPP